MMIRDRLLMLALFLCLGLMAFGSIFAGNGNADIGTWNYVINDNNGIIIRANNDGDTPSGAEGIAFQLGNNTSLYQPVLIGNIRVEIDASLIMKNGYDIYGDLIGNASTATSAGYATTAGTVTGASQSAITSVGTLTSLGVSGATTLNNTLSVDTNGATANITNNAGVLNLQNGSMSIGVTNAGGDVNGISANATSATMTGGTSSTTWVVDDNGARLMDSVNGQTFAVTNVGNTSIAGNLTANGATNNIGTSQISTNTIGNSTNGTIANIIGGASNIQVDNTSATMSNGSNSIDVSATANLISGTTNINTTAAAGTLTTIGNSANTVAQQSLQVNGAMSSTGNATIATAANTTNTFGSGASSNNTIGNAGTSTNTITGATNTITGATTIQNTAGGLNTVVVNAVGNVSGMTITGTTALNDATGSIGVAINGTASGSGGSYAVRITGTDASDGTAAVAVLDGSLASVVNSNSKGLNVIGTTTTLDGGTSAEVASTLTLSDTAASLLTDAGNGLTVNNSGAISLMNNTSGTGLSISADGNDVSLLNTVGAAGHGLTIGANSTTLSGGTNSSTWTMSDGDFGGAILTVAGSGSGTAQQLISATTSTDSSMSTLTLGNAGISVNSITGDANAMVADNAAADANFIHATAGGNTIQASTTNTITGGTGNAITATTGNNTISALGTNGSNNLMANATSGTNNIEAPINNIGVATPGSLNNIGNDDGETTVDLTGGNASASIANNAAGMKVNGAMDTSILTDATQGTSGSANIVMAGTNGATESEASLTLTNGIGNTHGVEVYENRTVLSGGTTSTSLTLHDWGATFSNNGDPARVTGVADGQDDFDAVNYRQLTKAYQGIAAISALAGIPAIPANVKWGFGAGYGYYENESAVAIGLKAKLTEKIVVQGGLGIGGIGESQSTYSANAGIFFGF